MTTPITTTVADHESIVREAHRRAAWRVWVAAIPGAAPDTVSVATDAAMQALACGASSTHAAIAAYRALDLPAPSELAAWASWEPRPAPPPPSPRTGWSPPPRPVGPPAGGAGASGAAPGRRPPRDDRDPDDGARILGSTGAFLLIAATALFEAFGLPRNGSGVPRFAVVLAVQSLLAAVSALCLRRRRLQPVAPIMLATTLLSFPLTLTAAAVFLRLGASGLRPAVGVARAAAACAGLYGLTAVLLRSSAYGLLSLAALASSAIAGGVVLFGPENAPLGLVLVVAACAAVDAAGPRRPRVDAAFGRWAMPGAVLSVSAAVVWAGAVIELAVHRGTTCTPPSTFSAVCRSGARVAHASMLVAVLAGSASAMAGAGVVRRRWRGPASVVGSAAALEFAWWSGTGRAGVAATLAGLAIVWAVAAARARRTWRGGGAPCR